MASIFLRIYGGMLAVIVLVALCAAFAVERLNDARLSHYREQLANGTFRLMADNLAPMSGLERARSLSQWGRLLGLTLRIEQLEQQDLDQRSQRQILERQVRVLKVARHKVRVYMLVDQQNPTVLVTDVEQISEQLARASAYLVIDELIRYPEYEQPGRLALLKKAKGFGFDLRLVSLAQANLDSDQKRRVEDGDTVMALAPGGDAMRVFTGIAGSTWVLELGPVYQMNPYPRTILMIIAVLGLSLIGLVIYLLVRQLERRLKALEATASAISQGDLQQRAVVGSGDAVGRLAQAFNHMTSHLQGSLAAQREMVNAVSHELRTPVARLRFALEMLADAPDLRARDKYLQSIDDDLQELDTLLDEILTYARFEHGVPMLKCQPVVLNELIDQLILELAPLRSEIHVQPGPYSASKVCVLEADARYLHRALQNLISNAMRHAEKRVWISYWVGNERCKIEVDDDGLGIGDEDRARIFNPFIRLDDSRMRASGGHGLGLAIVQKIVYWHGGEIEVDQADVLAGARFTLTLPRQQATVEQ